MIRIIAILLVLSPLLTLTQDDCPCCSKPYNQFDFWVGEWTVYDTAGNIVGENTIQKVEDGCLLTERWVGSGGSTGRSINFFDKTDSSWNQTWVDNSGNILNLKGNLIDGSMVMESNLIKGTKIDYYKNQISWKPNNDNSITQKWEILDKNDNVLQLIFLGIYKKQNNED